MKAYGILKENIIYKKINNAISHYISLISQKYLLFLSIFLSIVVLLIFSFNGLSNGMVVHYWVSMLTVPLIIIVIMELVKIIFINSSYEEPVSISASYIEFMTALAGFSALGVMASYGAVWGDGVKIVSHNDRILSYIDHNFLLFTWSKFDIWIKQSAFLVNVLRFFYNSISILPFVLAGLLLASEQNYQLCLFFVFICISAAITNTIFYFFPAFGPVALIHSQTTADASYLPSFKAALKKTGDFVFGMRSLDGVFMPTDKNGSFYMTGIVAFPSYHVILAIGVAYFAKYLKPLLKYLFWFFSAGMIIASVPIGGHYLVDAVGGCVVAFVTISFVGFLQVKQKK